MQTTYVETLPTPFSHLYKQHLCKARCARPNVGLAYCPDLVAHICQEEALCVGRSLRFLLCFLSSVPSLAQLHLGIEQVGHRTTDPVPERRGSVFTLEINALKVE